MRESIKSMRRFLAAPAWKGWIIDEFGAFKQARTDTEIDQYARNNSITINHVSSTAAMGRTGSSRGPGTGVLNSDLTVKGTIGLRVVDASAFVSISILFSDDRSDGFVAVHSRFSYTGSDLHAG